MLQAILDDLTNRPSNTDSQLQGLSSNCLSLSFKTSRTLHKKWDLEGEIIFKDNGFSMQVIKQLRLRLPKPNESEKDRIENQKIKSTFR